MEVSALAELQRTEVELVLKSGVFAKAPRLERFFEYICRYQLAGAGDQIKEYSVATEALGRGPDFDPKKDSIVRVEALRLRKRLEEYYAGPGANDPVRISIPHGQYRPLFITCETADRRPLETPVAVPTAPSIATELMDEATLLGPPKTHPIGEAALLSHPNKLIDPTRVIEPPAAKPGRPRRLWPVMLAAAICAALAASLFLAQRLGGARRLAGASASPVREEVWTPTQSAVPIPGEVRLLAGYHGAPVADKQGRNWYADAYFKGGLSSLIRPPYGDGAEAGGPPLRAQRAGQFRYDIPLRNRPYEMHLYVAETEYGPGNPKGGEAGARLFDVSVNGRSLLTAFDPLAAAGAPNRLYERVFKDICPAADGKLHLSFEPDIGDAFLNALALLPSSPGRVHPVRIVAQANPLMDSEGRLWAADTYYSGGRSVLRTSVVSNSPEALFQGERYGNFSYRIPLAPGKYRLTLYFAETWFGAESPDPAQGSRIFDVFANGRALLRNYQIVDDAGGPNRGIAKVFDNIEPNAHGTLLLDFVPLKNFAEVNAIEIVETN